MMPYTGPFGRLQSAAETERFLGDLGACLVMSGSCLLPRGVCRKTERISRSFPESPILGCTVARQPAGQEVVVDAQLEHLALRVTTIHGDEASRWSDDGPSLPPSTQHATVAD